MTDPNVERFNRESAQWDMNTARLNMAENIVKAIVCRIHPDTSMRVLDYGCGSGLITLGLAGRVGSITGVDSSRGMLDLLEAKLINSNIKNVTVLQGSALDGVLNDLEPFDLVVSNMVLHHIEDPASFIKTLFRVLKCGGRLAISDLCEEDGSFHEDKQGVYHNGFNPETLIKFAVDAGFTSVRVDEVWKMEKQTSTGLRKFPILLLTGERLC